MDRRLSNVSRSRIVAAFALALTVANCSSSNDGPSASPTPSTAPSVVPASDLAPTHGPYDPVIDPSNFVAVVDNRYWPLEPGTTYVYRGVRGATPQTDTEVVTDQTKQILGITATVVRDTVSEHGAPVERTFDWYAQDRQGNVWYMGEDSLEMRHGRFITASDSWEAGVDGAHPGIIVPAAPIVGEAYRQEYYRPGEALDEARVLSLNGSLQVPYGSYTGLLVTSERSPLEPQTEQKYYAPGVGEIAETVVKGHHEQFRLVSVTH
jgi:hypothetical protein